MQYTNMYQSPIGRMTMASDGEKLSGLWFDGQKYFGSTLSEEWEEKNLPVFEQTKQWLDCYFGGGIPEFTPPLLLNATPFRIAVWEILREIPYGQVVTYGRIANIIAARMGRTSMSAQAVGGAVGHNPISIIIPCHRVVASSGSLTGYAGGIEKKNRLLSLEQRGAKGI